MTNFATYCNTNQYAARFIAVIDKLVAASYLTAAQKTTLIDSLASSTQWHAENDAFIRVHFGMPAETTTNVPTTDSTIAPTPLAASSIQISFFAMIFGIIMSFLMKF